MADQFDFTNKNPPMQGITLADLVAAKTSPLTSLLQGLAPAIQALNARKMNEQKQQLITQASGGNPQTAGYLGLGMTPPEARAKPRIALSPESAGIVFDALKIPTEKRPQQLFEDEIPALKMGHQTPRQGDLSAEQKDNFAWGLQNKLVAPRQMTYRGPKAEILSNYLGEMRKGTRNRQSLIDLDAYAAGEQSRATSQATVQGKQGQLVGAAAGSMEDMIAKAAPLIAKVSRTRFKRINSALQSGLDEISDPDLQALYTYLTSAAGFYASLQKNGNAPDQEERKAAYKVISSLLNSGGFSAVQKALSNEAKSRTHRIKGAGFDEPNPMGDQPKASQQIGRYKVTHL